MAGASKRFRMMYGERYSSTHTHTLTQAHTQTPAHIKHMHIAAHNISCISTHTQVHALLSARAAGVVTRP